jgi:hypothetical protein
MLSNENQHSSDQNLSLQFKSSSPGFQSKGNQSVRE